MKCSERDIFFWPGDEPSPELTKRGVCKRVVQRTIAGGKQTSELVEGYIVVAVNIDGSVLAIGFIMTEEAHFVATHVSKLSS